MMRVNDTVFFPLHKLSISGDISTPAVIYTFIIFQWFPIQKINGFGFAQRTSSPIEIWNREIESS